MTVKVSSVILPVEVEITLLDGSFSVPFEVQYLSLLLKVGYYVRWWSHKFLITGLRDVCEGSGRTCFSVYGTKSEEYERIILCLGNRLTISNTKIGVCYYASQTDNQ